MEHKAPWEPCSFTELIAAPSSFRSGGYSIHFVPHWRAHSNEARRLPPHAPRFTCLFTEGYRCRKKGPACAGPIFFGLAFARKPATSQRLTRCLASPGLGGSTSFQRLSASWQPRLRTEPQPLRSTFWSAEPALVVISQRVVRRFYLLPCSAVGVDVASNRVIA